MKRYLPGRMETCVFVVMATICAIVVNRSASRDVALALLAMPVFLTAALLGMRRADATAEADAEEAE